MTYWEPYTQQIIKDSRQRKIDSTEFNVKILRWVINSDNLVITFSSLTKSDYWSFSSSRNFTNALRQDSLALIDLKQFLFN